MVMVIGLQPMIIVPSDSISFDSDTVNGSDVQGVLIDQERDESLIDQSNVAVDGEDRTTEIAVTLPFLNFKIISDSPIVQAVSGICLGIGFLLVAYKWYTNDSSE